MNEEYRTYGSRPASPTVPLNHGYGPGTGGDGTGAQSGMTIRCWLAGQALAGIEIHANHSDYGHKLTADAAVRIADAVIARLNEDT